MAGTHAFPALCGASRGRCEVDRRVGAPRITTGKEKDVDYGVCDPKEQAECDDAGSDCEE